ncbi:MAG: RNA 2',3'-cyclic phosphodiesterase [Clostridiales bacterium]|nr:RNA 2',3'-cyclic phosphodiesterase [Clostridiales bacterium]
MRLFTAILPDADTDRALQALVLRLREASLRGNFVRPGNLHLTLIFLGELPSPEPARAAMRSLAAEPFSLTLEGVGRFGRAEQALWWVGVNASAPLQVLHAQLRAALLAQRLDFDDRPYRPHLTLGRQVRLPPDVDPNTLAPKALTMPVRAVSLMRSDRGPEGLVYTELFRQPLSG